MKITINNAQIELSEEQKQDLLKQLKGENKIKIRPDDKEYYYYITKNGEIGVMSYGSSFDKEVWACGNGFFDKESAEKELAKRLAIQRVKDYVKLNNIEFEPDWKDDNQQKHYPVYSCGNIIADYEYDIKRYSPIGYLKSEEDCNKLIEDNKEDLLIIYK